MPTTKPPTSELGRVSNLDLGKIGDLLGWASVVTEYETKRELAFPASIETYRTMRKTDAHISAILQAIIIPVRRFGWQIDPNGAKDEVVERTARNMGLPIAGAEDETIPRSRNRFSHDRHLAVVLRNGLTYGWQMHEQVYTLTPDKKYDLRKLAERPQHTITDIQVATDGGLVGIKQGWGMDAPVVPVDRLVAYVWEQEAGSWVGESLLRPMYRPFKIKDRILRVGAINIERAGGIPWVEAAAGANSKELTKAKEFAQQFRVGEMSGGALPFGWQLKFAQAAGGNEAAEYVKLQNQEMSRRALAMFLDLGTTETGARALGEGFIDFFSLQLDTVADWYATITNEHVIEDFIDVNYGIDESAPRLTYTRDPNPELSIDALVQLVNSGLVVVDNKMEDVLRGKYKLPEAEREEIVTTTPPPPPAVPVPEEQLPIAAAIFAAKDPDGRVTLPARSLGRLPNEVEIAAAMDLEALDEAWQAALDVLVEEWTTIRQAQLDDLADQINAAKSLDDLTAIHVAADGAEELVAAMEDLVASGVTSAIEEAAAQGVTLAAPKLAEVEANVRERAEFIAQTLADELSVVASKAAARLDMDGAAVIAELSEGGVPAYVEQSLRGALTGAQNEGRFAVMESAGDDEPVEIYHSAILDTNTCDFCRAGDGTKYDSIAASLADFPAGFYRYCKGREKCRCTPVATYREGISAARKRDVKGQHRSEGAGVGGQFGYLNKGKGKNAERAKSSHRRVGDMTADEKIANYKTMHGKAPSAAQVKRLRAAEARQKKTEERAGTSYRKAATNAVTSNPANAKFIPLDQRKGKLRNELPPKDADGKFVALPKFDPHPDDPGPIEAHGGTPNAKYNAARLKAMDFDPEAAATPDEASLTFIGPAYKGEGSGDPTVDGYHSRNAFGSMGEDGKFNYTDPSRKALHDAILAHFLSGKKKPEGRKPVATYMAGGGGAGKGTALKGFVGTEQGDLIAGSVHIDPDEIKMLLPEFRALVEAGDGSGAGIAHEESSDIAKELQRAAREQGFDVLVDGTLDGGNYAKHEKAFQGFVDDGYDVDIVMVTTPTETALERGITRAFGDGESKQGSGRMVPPAMLRAAHKHASVNHKLWAKNPNIRTWAAFNTDVPRGEPAIPLASGGGGLDPVIVDQAGYDAMVAKADE